MAKAYRMTNELYLKHQRGLWSMIALVGLLVQIAVFLFVTKESERLSLGNLASNLIILIGLASLMQWSNQKSDQAGIAEAGEAGEAYVFSYLRELDNRFVLLTNLRPSIGQMKCECDVIVVGPTGVYVIEVKNYAGTLLGDTDQREWQHTKTHGEVESVGNPIRQVERHRRILQDVLAKNGLRVGICAVVAFVGSAELELYGVTQTLVYNDMGALCQTIRGTDASAVLSAQTVEATTACLLQSGGVASRKPILTVFPVTMSRTAFIAGYAILTLALAGVFSLWAVQVGEWALLDVGLVLLGAFAGCFWFWFEDPDLRLNLFGLARALLSPVVAMALAVGAIWLFLWNTMYFLIAVLMLVGLFKFMTL